MRMNAKALVKIAERRSPGHPKIRWSDLIPPIKIRRRRRRRK